MSTSGERAREASSGLRGKIDAVSMLASSDRGASQSRRKTLFVLVLAGGEEEQEALGALGDRYEIRFVDSAEAAADHIAHRTPDVLVLDDDTDDPDDAKRSLLERLSAAFAAPVVIVLTSSLDRPSIARSFGVPSVHKPVAVAELESAIEVALERNLRPVRRQVGE